MNKLRRSVTAVILARGGSKGVPGKNLVKLKGETLVARDIKLLQSIRNVAEIIVSSDDQNILQEAAVNGAIPLKRPSHLAQDETTSVAAIRHICDTFDLNDQDWILLSEVTSPFKRQKTILDMIYAIESNKRQVSIVSARKTSYIFYTEYQDRLLISSTESRRQDRNAQFIIAGGIFLFTCGYARRNKNLFDNKSILIEVSLLESLDINSIEDLELVRAIIGG